MKKFIEFITEDGDGGGGVASASATTTSGMGSVVSAQPSSNAGQTISPGYEAGGGSVGSGDIGVPFGTYQQQFPYYNNNKKSKKRKKRIKKESIITSFDNFDNY